MAGNWAKGSGAGGGGGGAVTSANPATFLNTPSQSDETALKITAFQPNHLLLGATMYQSDQTLANITVHQATASNLKNTPEQSDETQLKITSFQPDHLLLGTTIYQSDETLAKVTVFQPAGSSLLMEPTQATASNNKTEPVQTDATQNQVEPVQPDPNENLASVRNWGAEVISNDITQAITITTGTAAVLSGEMTSGLSRLTVLADTAIRQGAAGVTAAVFASDDVVPGATSLLLYVSGPVDSYLSTVLESGVSSARIKFLGTGPS